MFQKVVMYVSCSCNKSADGRDVRRFPFVAPVTIAGTSYLIAQNARKLKCANDGLTGSIVVMSKDSTVVPW